VLVEEEVEEEVEVLLVDVELDEEALLLVEEDVELVEEVELDVDVLEEVDDVDDVEEVVEVDEVLVLDDVVVLEDVLVLDEVLVVVDEEVEVEEVVLVELVDDEVPPDCRLKVAVKVAGAAGAMMAWEAAPPSDQLW